MRLRRWFRFLPTERRAEVLEQLSQASSPGFDFFLLVVLSCSIATLGLITDSAAVIIGAMLVAPLMSPILGLSLASVAGERHVFQHALIALIEGAALALSLPSALGADRDLIRVMAFGVVLFTLLGQATTMRPLIRWLRIVTRGEAQVEYEMRHARLTTLRAADARLDRLHAEGLLSTPTW